MKVKLKVLSLLALVFISCFSATAAAATPGVSIQDGEDWSLPSWITGWSPYGGIYMLWYGYRVPVNNPNVDVHHGTRTFKWSVIHTGPNQFNWSIVDNQIANVADAGKKYIFWYSGGRGAADEVPPWVIDQYPGTPTYTLYGRTHYKVWASGMGDELKNFAQAFGNRYKNDDRVAYAYYVQEPGVITWSAGIPKEEYLPFYDSLLRKWVNSLGAQKVIETGRGGAVASLDTLAMQLGANVRSGGGYDPVQELDGRPWLDQRYDLATGYIKALKQPTPFFGTENEECGAEYDYLKLLHLSTLAMRFNYHLYHAFMYLVEDGQNWTDPTTGITFIGSVYAPIRDYIRKVQGYPSDKAPDAYAVLREMNRDWPKSGPTAYPPMRNIERFLYQRDGISGGLTKRVEQTVWDNLIDIRGPQYSLCGYTAKDKIGYEARSTDKATANNYIYFGLDDAFMNGGTNNVQIKVYYEDTGTATWRIEYDAADGNKYKPTQSVTNTNSGKWKTATFTINDAKFANGQGTANGIDINSDGDYQDAGEKDGLDFRIYNGGSEDIIVGLVRLLRLDNPSAGTTPNGDLNADGKVNITDIQLCVKVILGRETDPEIIKRAKEVALPLDKVDIKDIQGIVKIILGR